MTLSANIPTNRVKNTSTDIERYTCRRPARHQAEMALIERTFPTLSSEANVLDAPCGAGRVSIWLAKQGYQVSALDLGEAAVNFTRNRLTENGFKINALQGNIFHLPWHDNCFDAVICFRVLHHFADPNLRALLLQELARVSQQHLLISYLSPWSSTGIKRRIKKRITKKSYSQNHTHLNEIKEILDHQGFDLVQDNAQMRFIHSLHLAHFRRRH